MRRLVDGPVYRLLHDIVRRSVRRFVPLHSALQWAAHGIMAETVRASVRSPMRQTVHDIVLAFVHNKVHCTEGIKNTLIHSVVH